MKKQFIGTYEIGFERCRLMVSDGYEGSFDMLPGDSRLPEITIGLANKLWWRTLTILQHEAFEFAMTRQGCRYDPNQDLGNSHSSYVFMMDHTKFSNVCAIATDFISSCQADLHRAWRTRKKDFPGIES